MHATVQPTIWEVPDDGWTMLEPTLDECDPATPTGHRRVDLRRGLKGSILRLRPGCPWHQLPRQFGDDRTVHRHCQPWGQRGIWARLWAVLVEACDAGGGVDWPWHAADAALGKARLDGDLVGRPPRPREQGGERRLVVGATGGPLGAPLAGANVRAPPWLAATLEAMVVERPQPREARPPHRCLDQGDENPTGHETVAP